MKKLLPILIILSFFVSSLPGNVYAQSATDSATATESATATSSGSVDLPETLPETGSTDTFTLFVMGMIFLAAGSTSALILKNRLQDSN